MIIFSKTPFQTDDKIIQNLLETKPDVFKSIPVQDVTQLLKSIEDRSHLVPKIVYTSGEKTRPHKTTVYVNPNGKTSSEKEHKHSIVLKWKKNVEVSDELQSQANTAINNLVHNLHELWTSETSKLSFNSESIRQQVLHKYPKLAIKKITASKADGKNMTLKLEFIPELSQKFTDEDSSITLKRIIQSMFHIGSFWGTHTSGSIYVDNYDKSPNSLSIDWENWNPDYKPSEFIAKPRSILQYSTDFKHLQDVSTDNDIKTFANTESCQTWLKSLTPTEKKSGKSYISDNLFDAGIPMAEPLNNFHRIQRLNLFDPTGDFGVPESYSKKFTKTLQKSTVNLDSMIDKFELSQPIMVHRYIPVTNKNILSTIKQAYVEGIPYQDKGYISTTLKSNNSVLESEMKEFNDKIIRLHIKVPSGKGVGAYIAPLAPKNLRYQEEFLLARGTQFKVVTDMSKATFNSEGIMDIHLEAIGRSVYNTSDTIKELESKQLTEE